MIGMLDRFEDEDQAVILIDEIQKALIIPTCDLPKGSKEGTYFNIEEKDGHYTIISIDQYLTEKEARKSEELLEKLRAYQKESKFKRK